MDDFWSANQRNQTSTRTMLNPQAPHRSRTHTHPTPTTPRPACASARRVHAALRAVYTQRRVHAALREDLRRKPPRELDANSPRTPRETVVLKRDFGGFENQILRIIFQGRWGEPRHPFLPPHSHGCWCPWYQHSGRARACWENI